MSSSRWLGGGVALLAAAVLAGCSGSSAGDAGSTSATTGASSPLVSAPPPPAGSVAPTASTTSTTSVTSVAPTAGSTPPTSASTPVATASVAQPPDPVVAAGNQGAWTLTRAAPGQPAQQQVPSLRCGSDGSVTAPGLSLSAGAARLTLTDPAVTVAGTAELDAAGGTFRGRNADTAVAFTWSC